MQEKLLIDLGLARSYFKLDDISNIAWCKFDVQGDNNGLTWLFATAVDATLHATMDNYDIFAITVSLNYGNNILAFLEEDLVNRQSVMDETGCSLPRNFQASWISPLLFMSLMSVQYFLSTKFQPVVLHLDQLLPHCSTLLRHNLDDSYTPYKISSDKLLQ